MKKAKVNPRVYAALFLSKKTAKDKVTMGNYLFLKMSNNLNFLTPSPTLLEFQTSTLQLDTAITAAEAGGALEKQALVTAEGTFDTLAVRLKEYAENVANAIPEDAAEILLSGGFTISKTPEKAGLPPQPALVAKFTNISGTIKLLIKGLSNATRFEILISTNPGVDNSWTDFDTTTKRRYIAAGLTPGTNYSFKVVPYGTAGAGPESPVASQLAAK